MGTSIKNLVHAIVNLGHQVSLFIYGQNKSQVFTENGIVFHLIAKQNYSFLGFYRHRKFIENYINTHTASVDILEAPGWTGITAFMYLKKPLVIRFHGSDTYFLSY